MYTFNWQNQERLLNQIKAKDTEITALKQQLEKLREDKDITHIKNTTIELAWYCKPLTCIFDCEECEKKAIKQKEQTK
jgi:hypothetical protein